ncbi:MAG: flagellar hook-associated protein FlgK [Clostridiales bacterium]|nr:flagellar hook-associated protein FlgK [Clostridiales bacterium]
MRPTFLAFHTASRALAASQANMDVTGNNIANVNTAGYTRQRVDLNSISSSGYAQKFATPGASVGYGVEVNRISQIRDPFLDARYRDQASDYGRLETILSGLTDLENIFDEASTEGLLYEISKFVNELQTLSQTPAAGDIALITRTAAQKVTQIMNVYAKQVTQVRNQQVFDLSKVVIENEFNTKVKNIADLNAQIRKEQTYGNIPNELMDKRNLLIDELSELANIKVTYHPERISEDLVIERLTISLQDTATGASIGLVDNELYNTLHLNDNGDSVTINIASSFDAPENADITNRFSGGKIRGYLDLINGEGINEFRGTLYYRNSMDIFASNFARVLNDLNTIDPANPKPLFTASDGGPITAENIRISDQWLADPSFITTTLDGADGSDNILRMISAIDSEAVFYKDAADPSSEIMFRGSFDEFMSGLIGEVALDVELYQNYYDTSVNVMSNLFAARESISGVNLDEEGINLMAYQKTYNAAARYFTALDEAVDTIINRMGIVGR